MMLCFKSVLPAVTTKVDALNAILRGNGGWLALGWTFGSRFIDGSVEIYVV